MTIKIKGTDVSPLVAVKWHIESLKDELAALDDRTKRVPEFPSCKVERAKRDAIDQCLRRAQYYFGWTKGSITNFLGVPYRESCFQQVIERFISTPNAQFRAEMKDIDKNSTIEHVIPVAVLRNKILENSEPFDKFIAESLLTPVALLSKNTEKLIKEKSITENEFYPFQRYAKYKIKIVSHNNLTISESWSIKDHFSMIAEKPEFKEIIDYYDIKINN